VATILNLQSLLRELEKLERESLRKDTGDVVVGYNASYALAVHENIEMRGKGKTREFADFVAYKGRSGGGHHIQFVTGKKGNYWDPPGAQAKFLEQPFREMRPEMVELVIKARRKGAGIVPSLLYAGLRLQRASQKLVPVDTGNLKGSAFTERE